MGRICVGVDGSEQSLAALRWALEAAQLRGAELEVIHAWQVPVPAMMFEGAMAPPNIDFEREAAELVATLVKEATDGAEPPVVLRTKTPNAPAAKALIDASEGAEMLVVASRGHGGFASLLLGSVSQQVAHHARCPVVIVHPTDRA